VQNLTYSLAPEDSAFDKTGKNIATCEGEPMSPNRSILPSYRPTAAAPCLLAVLFLLLTQPASAQITVDYSKNSHQPYLELLHRVQAEGTSPAKLGYVWALVASSYQRSGETDAAIRAYSQALPLLAKTAESRVNYATALDNLGEVYLEVGDVKDAERVREKAFAIRSELGNPVDLARSHEHLAEILLAQHRFKPAQEHAQAAATMLTTSSEPAYLQVMPNPGAQIPLKPGNTLVAAYITLTYAQCEQNDTAGCMRSAQMADQVVTRDFAPVSLERAHADLALAFADWKNGNVGSADGRFQAGLEMMKKVLGETHPVVITSMIEYRDFLKGSHQDTRANVLTRSIESAQAFHFKETCAMCVVSVAALP
jgi:tetratricopeptide (TPR) repeat protein